MISNYKLRSNTPIAIITLNVIVKFKVNTTNV